jgi:PTS system galactitol-specific IIA component
MAADATLVLNDQELRLVVLRDVDAANTDDVFQAINSALHERGWVADTFLDALRRREEEFPTGIDFGGFSVALPHADPEHVREPGIVVATMRAPVTFQAMDDPSQALDCRLAVMPILTDAKNQVPFLAAITGSLQDRSFYQSLLDSGSDTEVADRLQAAFDSEGDATE